MTLLLLLKGPTVVVDSHVVAERAIYTYSVPDRPVFLFTLADVSVAKVAKIAARLIGVVGFNRFGRWLLQHSQPFSSSRDEATASAQSP